MSLSILHPICLFHIPSCRLPSSLSHIQHINDYWYVVTISWRSCPLQHGPNVGVALVRSIHFSGLYSILVGAPLFSISNILTSAKFSTILLRGSVYVLPHISLYALRSPRTRTGLGNCSYRSCNNLFHVVASR